MTYAKQVSESYVRNNMYHIHKANLQSVINDFIPTCHKAMIFEHANYFYKIVSVFGKCEMRLWKKSGRVSMVYNEKKFTRI